MTNIFEDKIQEVIDYAFDELSEELTVDFFITNDFNISLKDGEELLHSVSLPKDILYKLEEDILEMYDYDDFLYDDFGRPIRKVGNIEERLLEYTYTYLESEMFDIEIAYYEALVDMLMHTDVYKIDNQSILDLEQYIETNDFLHELFNSTENGAEVLGNMLIKNIKKTYLKETV